MPVRPGYMWISENDMLRKIACLIHNPAKIMSISELKQLDFRLLLAFCAVAEELHFGRAAARLHISQPPLSKYINRLEQLVGTPLFVRNTRTVKLTAAGSYFYAEVRSTCDDMAKALHQARGIGRVNEGVLTVGIAPTVAHTHIVGALHAYRMVNPEVDLRLQEMNSVDMLSALRLKAIDVAIMRPLSANEDIITHSIYQERVGLVARKDDMFTSTSSISLARIMRHPLIGYNEETSPYFSRLLKGLLAQSTIKPNIVQYSQLPTILTLVEAGVGIAIVAESFAAHYSDRLHFAPIQEAGAIVVQLVLGILSENRDPLAKNFVASVGRYLDDVVPAS